MKKIVSILLLFSVLADTCAKCQIITTVAGGATGHGGYWGDGGPATAAEIGYFGSVAVDSSGNIYIGDGNNHRVRKVNALTGIITTIAGTGTAGYNGDGIPATSAKLDYPGTITFDSHGNIYIVDGNNFRIRKIDILTGIISTYVGNGIMGSSGDGGPATAASIATGYVAWDNLDNLYIICSRKIRKISPTGIISTIAGTGLSGSTGEGVPATATNLGGPRGIATDVLGNVYFGDSTSAIRKITISTGIINRVAGTGNNIHTPYTGDGIPATACHIGTFGIAVDNNGNIYNSDHSNSRIEKIDAFGIINSIVGIGTAGFSGDGGPATAAQISYPEYVALDRCNNVYIADFNNKRVRKVTFNPPPCAYLNVNEQSVKKEVSIYPNPANDVLHINTSPGLSLGEVVLCNMLGVVVLSEQLNNKQKTINIKHLPPGLYLLAITDEEGKRTVHKIIKE